MHTNNPSKSRIMTGIFIALGIGILLLSCLFVWFVSYFLMGGPAEVTDDASQYEATMRKYTSEVVGTVHTGFFSFPESIPGSAMDNGPVFYFSYQDTWDDPTCEVYLKCTYSDEDYAREIERLKSTVYELESGDIVTRNSLEYDESTRFIRPAYKAIDCDNHSYEYALDLGENQIAYIYTSFKDTPKDLKAIPPEYLPSDFEESLRGNSYGNGRFNVYTVERTDEYTTFDYDR